MTGKFIVVEGLEGAGKSSAIQTIKKYCHDKGIVDIITTREPGGTPIAEQLRLILKSQHEEPLMDMTELLLMYAARVQLVNTVILPALKSDIWVIGDRHELSTRAYQGGGRGIPDEQLQTLWRLCLNGFKPDLTLYLDIAPEVGFQRIVSRGKKDRIEQEALDFFTRVRKVYQRYATENSDIYIVNASQDLSLVHKEMTDVLDNTVFNHD